MGLFSLFGKKQQGTEDDLDLPVKPRRSRTSKSQEGDPLDPMLPEKKRARRRLIGATALVLAAVIGLPMIFDTEPKPLSSDIAIQIPPRDKSANSSTLAPLPLSPEPLPEIPAVSPPVSQPASQPMSQPTAPPVSLPGPASKSASSPTPAPAAKPAGQKSQGSTPEPKLSTAPKASTAPNVEKSQAKPTPKITDPSADKVIRKDKAQFIVQVAAVTSKVKADELQARLKKAGIKSYLQKVSTKDGERFRIRVGPFASREEADRMRTRLGKLGLTGSLQSV